MTDAHDPPTPGPTLRPAVEGAALGALLLLAAAFRVARWQLTAVMFNDGPIFLAMARALEQGDVAAALASPFHPLYPALVAALAPALGSLEAAGVAVSVVAGTLAVAALWAFVRRAFGPAEAAVAAALLAVHPMAVEYTGDVQSEGVYLLLFLAAAASLWRALSGLRPAPAAVGGLLAGAAYLVRPEGLGLALVAGGLLGWRALAERDVRRRALLAVVALAAGALLASAPYLVWIRADQGSWALTRKKSVAVVAGLAEAPRQGPDPRPAGARPARIDPAAAARLEQPGPPPSRRAALGDWWKAHVRGLHYTAALLLLAELVLGGWRRPGLRAAFVGGVVAAYALVLLGLALQVGYVSARHALPPLTLTLGYAASGLLRVARRAGHAGRPPAAGAARRTGAAAAALLLAATLAGALKALHPDRTEDLAARRAAEWLRASGAPVEGVAARRRRTAWYADAPHVEIPEHVPVDADLLRRAGASHLVLDDEDGADLPALAASLPAAAHRVHRSEAAGHRATVWALSPSGPAPEPGSRR